jgi:hypothetical protein
VTQRQSATGDNVHAVGDSFVVPMDREALNDYPELGKYDVTVEIRTFEQDREIAWYATGNFVLGHFYGYLLEPAGANATGRDLLLRLVGDRPGMAGERHLPGDQRRRAARDPRHPRPHGPATLSALAGEEVREFVATQQLVRPLHGPGFHIEEAGRHVVEVDAVQLGPRDPVDRQLK